jgi:cellulose synthase/poly-beta-1,6-N-acetylglucosamine synthase-like glycosyltransferase
LRFSIAMVFHNEGLGIERSALHLIRAANRALEQGMSVEVLLIDNASSDHSRAIAEGVMNAHQVPYRSFVRASNEMAGARTQAVHEAQYEYLLFLDSDCLAHADWLVQYAHWVKDFGAQKWTGIGGANLLVGKNEQAALFDCVEFLRGFPILFLKSAQLRNIQSGKNQVRHLSTCNVLYKKSSLLEVNGFPGWAKRVGEDLALSAELIRRGGVLYQVSGTCVDHLDSLSWESWLKKMLRYGSAQMRVLLRYPFWIQPTKLAPLGVILVLLIFGFALGLWSVAIILLCTFASLALHAMFNERQNLAIKWPVFLMSSAAVYCLGYFLGLYEEMRGILGPSASRDFAKTESHREE